MLSFICEVFHADILILSLNAEVYMAMVQHNAARFVSTITDSLVHVINIYKKGNPLNAEHKKQQNHHNHIINNVASAEFSNHSYLL